METRCLVWAARAVEAFEPGGLPGRLPAGALLHGDSHGMVLLLAWIFGALGLCSLLVLGAAAVHLVAGHWRRRRHLELAVALLSIAACFSPMGVWIVSIACSVVVIGNAVSYGYFALRTLLRRESRTPPVGLHTRGSLPSVTVVVPAKDEATVIEDTLRALDRIDYPATHLEIVLIDDGSTDATRPLARALADQLSHRLSIVSHEQSGGKARRLNELACTLTSEFLLVLDADHWVEPDIVKRMLDRFDEGADVACVQIASAVRNADTNLLTRALEMEYLCRCQGIYPGKGVGIFVGSGGMFRRTELLLAGGFDASMLTEDVELSYRLYKNGKRVVYEHRLCSHELATTDFRNFFNQRHRWMRGLWQAMLHHVWETGTHPSFRRARPYFVQFTCDGLGALCLSVLQAYCFLHLLGWLHFELFLPIYVMLASCSFAFGVGFLRGNRLRNVLYLPIVPLYMIMHNIPMSWALIDSYVFGTAVTWVKTERVSERPPSLRSRRRRA